MTGQITIHKKQVRRKTTEQISGATDQQVKHAMRIYRKLAKRHPNVRTALKHHNPWQLLVATILSAQCTDARVNMVTPVLFERYPDAGSMARARLNALESVIRSTGFYRNKAKAIKGASKVIVDQFGGKVPDNMNQLLELPGVARKTANVVLGNAFDKNEGVVVDTHVARLSRRMGLTEHKDPGKIERDLMALFNRKHWTDLPHMLIEHGRSVCTARKPMCDNCELADDCPKTGVTSPS